MNCEFEDVIESLAYSLQRRHKYVEVDDLKQEMYCWWFDPKNMEARERYLAGGTEGQAKLQRALGKHAYMYCLAEQAQLFGFEPEDYYFYSRKQIEELLPYACNPEEMVFVANTEKVARSNGDPAEGGNFLAMVADVARIVRELSGEDRAFLSVAHRMNRVWDDLGEFYGIQPDSTKKRYGRIVERVHRRLGGSKPDGFEEYVGKRRAVSNAAAIAATREGE